MTKKQLRGDAKRESILEIAFQAFLDNGYAGTSMATIAARVGGSKGTLYSFFASKEELFFSVLDARIEVHGAPIRAAIKAEGPPRQVLFGYGTKLMQAILSDAGLAFQRLIIAESERFPELARVFYERGPKRGLEELAQYFSRIMQEGLLREADPLMVARQFNALCRMDFKEKRLWGVLDTVSAEQIDETVRAAVETILAAYTPVQ
ncbi:TetR/AcrR family transcriptional regulator [Pseudokordiimonas caeni]|uniref:TetR/AcrR family transcriptional regulator n=1 Tax=Pseudokordiimonas caeni TaxID=2997908 RepID=UPI002810DB8F|nr:TetR/AcrR family transcriptional regulator [Pseudokordiimonas caeni]